MQEIDVKKLFEIALDQVATLEEELSRLAQLLRENYELAFFFGNPLVPKESKKKALIDISPNSSTLFRDLVNLLINEGIEKSIAGLSEQFTKMVIEQSKITFVKVKSPYPLSEVETNEIKNFVGGKAYLRIKIDPSLIGGIEFLTSDGRFFDGSLKGRLERLQEELIYA